jgi:hypothetical protein
MKKWSWWFMAVSFVVVSILSGCGGGGEGTGSSSTVSGVAATGSPMSGTVFLKDSSSPTKEISTAIDSDGSYVLNVDGLKAPFLLKASGTSGGNNSSLYSFSTGAGIANINPFSNLAVSIASGGADLAGLYSAPDSSVMQKIATYLTQAVSDIQTKLQPLFTLYHAGYNPVSDIYKADHQGVDGILDTVSIDISSTGTVSLTNKLNNAVIYTASTTNFTSGTLSSNLPQPPVVVAITPTTATLAIKGTANFTASVVNSTDTKVTWSVVESNGGSISSSGVYTAPSIEGTYHVKAISTADPTKSATATVSVTSGTVSVTINPNTATVAANGTKSFTVTVSGTSNNKVTWSVVESNGGTINSSGVYSAPATQGTYHVKAVSGADQTKSATATVTVTAAPQPFPIGTWVGPNGLSITVNKLVSSGLVNQYSGTISYPSLAGGSVNVSGTDPGNQIVAFNSSSGSDMSVTVTQISGTNYTSIGITLTGGYNASSMSGAIEINTSNAAYNYFNLNASFHKQ